MFPVVVEVLIIYIALCHIILNCLGNWITACYIEGEPLVTESKKVPDISQSIVVTCLRCGGSFSVDLAVVLSLMNRVLVIGPH